MSEFTYLITERKYLTKEQLEKLSYFCYSDGQIISCFENYKGKAILCLNDNFDIVGWSFLFEYPGDVQKTFYLWVGKKYRRLGIGKTLYGIAQKLNNNEEFTVSRHNLVAKKFYDSIKRSD